MTISAMGRYACLAVITLARHRHDGPFVNAAVIAREFDIPRPFLAHVLLRLKAAELVESTRGMQGGYRLARAAAAISLREVLTAIDGDGGGRPSGRGPHASLLDPVVERLYEAELAALAVLDRVTIDQLVISTGDRKRAGHPVVVDPH